MTRYFLPVAVALMLFVTVYVADAQEKSVRPGINDNFKDPDLRRFLGTFEGESREIFVKRKEIVAACKLKPGMAVADVGAGTGLFTRMFAKEVGESGKIYAVDIAEKFLKHIDVTSKEAGLKNIVTVQCKADSSELKMDSVDLVFICDTYHHFEFPQKTLATIQKALKRNGRLVLIDFHRIEGKSSDFVMGHVRAGQEVFEKEITNSGFKKVEQVDGILKENYLVIFEKTSN